MCADAGQAGTMAGYLNQVTHKASTVALGGPVCPAPVRPARGEHRRPGWGAARGGRPAHTPLPQAGSSALGGAIYHCLGFQGRRAGDLKSLWLQAGARVQQWAVVSGTRGCPSSHCPREAVI